MKAFSASLHRRLGFAVCLLLAGAVAAACSDDGNLLGTENGGKGGEGQPMAGSASGGSGGVAGTATNGGKGGATQGGASQGGAAGNAAGTASGGVSGGGGSGAGGEPACEQGLCIRANVCLDRCGGTQIYTGCCACPANTVEELTCTGNGGSGGGGADCAGETCASNETCVGYRVVGGALFPPDQNNECPAGRHLEANTCQYDFSYTCASLTNCNAPSATCRCATGTDCANTTQCRLPQASAYLDPDAQLVCELLAP